MSGENLVNLVNFKCPNKNTILAVTLVVGRPRDRKGTPPSPETVTRRVPDYSPAALRRLATVALGYPSGRSDGTGGGCWARSKWISVQFLLHFVKIMGLTQHCDKSIRHQLKYRARSYPQRWSVPAAASPDTTSARARPRHPRRARHPPRPTRRSMACPVFPRTQEPSPPGAARTAGSLATTGPPAPPLPPPSPKHHPRGPPSAQCLPI